jgi:multiple sugar transport system substrate-binding protein
MLPVTLAMVMLMGMVLSGCSSSSNSQSIVAKGDGAGDSAQQGKIIIKLFGIPNTDEFDTLVKPVEKLFPNITLQRVDTKLGENVAEQARQLVVAGTIPDIVTFPTQDALDMKEMGLFSDLTPLMKKHNLDLQRIVPDAIANIKAYSDPGTVMLLPRQRSSDVLFYNKDIFDRFGVSYPNDGMTWDEIYELARKVTRNDNGTQYRGIDVPNYMIRRNQLSLSMVDPKTMKASFNSDSWKNWFLTFAKLYSIEGNLNVAPGRQIPQAFTKDKVLAMAVNGPRTSEFEQAYDSGFRNWDLVTLPSLKEKPGFTNQSESHYYAIPPTGKNKDAALQVLSAFLSNDGQIELAKSGKLPTIREQSVYDYFMKDNRAFQGKNIAAFFKNEGAVSPLPTPFDDIAFSSLNNAFKQMAAGTADVNTALRNAEEEVNKQIAAKQ